MFDSLQSLWSYSLYCRICKDICRDIDIVAGPDDLFRVDNYVKNNNILTMHIILRQSYYKHNYQIDIDTVKGSLNVLKRNSSPDMNELYFYTHSFCKNCHSYTNSADIEIDFKNKKIKEVALEQEAFSLEKYRDKYFVSFHYDSNEMYISRLIDNDGYLKQDEKEFTLPIVSLDFSNERKVVDKIKTLLIFS